MLGGPQFVTNCQATKAHPTVTEPGEGQQAQVWDMFSEDSQRVESQIKCACHLRQNTEAQMHALSTKYKLGICGVIGK